MSGWNAADKAKKQAKLRWILENVHPDCFAIASEEPIRSNVFLKELKAELKAKRVETFLVAPETKEGAFRLVQDWR